MDTNLGRIPCRLLLTLVLILLAANTALAATVTFVRDRDFEDSFPAEIKIDGALTTRLDPGQRYVVDLPPQSYAVEIAVTSLFGTKYVNFTLEVADPSPQVVFLSVVEERRNGQNVKHKLFTEAAFKESKYASLLRGRIAAEVPQKKKPALGNARPVVARATPTANSAKVSFVRENDFSVFATIDVLIDGEKVATLKTKETAAVQLPRGGHVIDLVTKRFRVVFVSGLQSCNCNSTYFHVCRPDTNTPQRGTGAGEAPGWLGSPKRLLRPGLQGEPETIGGDRRSLGHTTQEQHEAKRMALVPASKRD